MEIIVKMPIYNGKDLIGIADIEETAFENLITLVQNGCSPKIDIRETGSLKIAYEIYIQNMPFVSKYKHGEEVVKKEMIVKHDEMDNSIYGLEL